jgi:hypothetical protein
MGSTAEDLNFTLACVMVRGKRRDYTPIYVERLRDMVRRHTDRPFRTVCLTDQPDKMPAGVMGVKVKSPMEGTRGWWRKIMLFHPKMPFKGRVLYLDLDVLVVGDINPILDFPADFAIAPDSAPTFGGKDHLRTVKGYQSSVMVWDHQARQQFYTEFDRTAPRRLWGDQDFLKEKSPNERTFPGEWFRRLTPDGPKKWLPETKIVLCVKWKNHKAVELFPWFQRYWVGPVADEGDQRLAVAPL